MGFILYENDLLLEGVDAMSSGVKASGKVNPHAKKLLQSKGLWRESYHSKTLDSMMVQHYDMIVTVCDHAHETCPIFPRDIPQIHVGFEDPDGKGYEAFEACLVEIIMSPIVKTTK